MAVFSKIRYTVRTRHESLDLDHINMASETQESSPRGEYPEDSSEYDASTSDLDNPGNPSSNWKGFIHMLKKGPKRIQTLHPLTIPKLSRRKSRSARHDVLPVIPALDPNMYYLNAAWKIFTPQEIQEATNDYSQENLIGEGGYAKVYKGVLPDGRLVAIKRLTKGDVEEMAADFLCELGIMFHVSHPNIARVIGYSVEGALHLVLQLSPNGSLESVLRGEREKLEWGIRYKIAVGAAQGLHYLHEGCQRRIIHRDIKAANILLSEDFEAQISDFGLAKWLPEQWTHHTVSKIEGTFGYLPPEFFMHGIVDEKTDVYAYGVLLLELLTGRLALDNTQRSLVMWAKPLLEKNNYKDLLDPYISDSYDSEQMKLMVLTAMMCIHQSSVERPEMGKVVEILLGETDPDELEDECRKPSLKRTYSFELEDAEEYNSTKYLSDVDQLMRIALDL